MRDLLIARDAKVVQTERLAKWESCDVYKNVRHRLYL
jgi:hypothetical protein